MAVESAPFINSLNAAQPDGASAKSEGDDHLRLLKSSIKATFPNVAGAVTATHAELSLLAGKTDVATQADIDDAVLTATIPGVDDPANASKYLKGGGVWASVDLLGEPIKDKGNSGTTAQVVNYLDGEGQTITATGAHSLTVSNFPANRIVGILLRMKAYGDYSLTTTGITWIKADGSETTNFAASGITLSTGTSNVALWSHGDGIVYGKLVK